MLEKFGKKIIVSADDFGISQKASQKIIDLVRKNKIDRVEVMISKNIAPSHIEELLRSNAKLDIHLHLLGSELDRWQNEPRTIESGVVKRGLYFLISYFFGKGRPRKAREYWEGQILEFQKMFGRIPDGVSSHEHIHFFSPYFKIASELAEKYNISYIRLGKYPLEIKESRICAILNWLKKRNYQSLKSSNLDTSDYMVSFDWMGRSWENFPKNISAERITEIVFHPELDPEYKALGA